MALGWPHSSSNAQRLLIAEYLVRKPQLADRSLRRFSTGVAKRWVRAWSIITGQTDRSPG